MWQSCSQLKCLSCLQDVYLLCKALIILVRASFSMMSRDFSSSDCINDISLTNDWHILVSGFFRLLLVRSAVVKTKERCIEYRTCFLLK